MNSGRPALDPDQSRPNAALGIEGRILRLVKSAPERKAIESGQVDAVIDRATGKAFLLPEAQQALREDQARVRRLLALSSDWQWQQDELYCFVSHTGIASGNSGIFDESIIGKTLRDSPFDGMSEVDWDSHRRLLEWRATFRDLELRCTGRVGEVRWVSISGEPTFDEQDRFTGYCGTMRDITVPKHSQVLAQDRTRFARDTLDALAVQVCVLDSTGIVIMANQLSAAFATGNTGIGAQIPMGASYLKACDEARGEERTDGVAIAAGIRRVIAGASPLFRHEYVCKSPNGRCRFDLTVTVFPGDGAARVVLSRENITERTRVKEVFGKGVARTRAARESLPDYKREERLLPGSRHKVAKGDPNANGLLSVLGNKSNLLAGLEPVTLTYGEVLFESGEPIRHVYFPNNCLVSLLTTVEGRHAMEVGLVGREGMVGISIALGMESSPVRALVLATGTAMRMEASRFRKVYRESPPLQNEVCRYTNAMLAQTAQTAACHRFHVLEARLARWLLMTHDRIRSSQFFLTQEILADMLGVRRVAVSGAAGALQERDLISYSRGKIRILDRKGLEATSCECYRIITDLYDITNAV